MGSPVEKLPMQFGRRVCICLFGFTCGLKAPKVYPHTMMGNSRVEQLVFLVEPDALNAEKVVFSRSGISDIFRSSSQAQVRPSIVGSDAIYVVNASFWPFASLQKPSGTVGLVLFPEQFENYVTLLVDPASVATNSRVCSAVDEPFDLPCGGVVRQHFAHYFVRNRGLHVHQIL